MKKLMMWIVSGVSVVVLSGCGGGSSDTVVTDTEITSVDILDLNRGYLVTGLNDGNDIVEMEFCGNLYDEYINYAPNLSGTYEINTVYVDFDYTGDANYDYYIDTAFSDTDYNFVVGNIYDIYDDQDSYIDSWKITTIELIECLPQAI